MMGEELFAMQNVKKFLWYPSRDELPLLLLSNNDSKSPIYCVPVKTMISIVRISTESLYLVCMVVCMHFIEDTKELDKFGIVSDLICGIHIGNLLQLLSISSCGSLGRIISTKSTIMSIAVFVVISVSSILPDMFLTTSLA